MNMIPTLQPTSMKEAIQEYNNKQEAEEKEISDLLAATIDSVLPEAENKIWHAHPVWFIENNPIVGYSKQKSGIRLMFWSGIDFGEEKLVAGTGKSKDASIRYTSPEQVDQDELKSLLLKSRHLQWDYKNIVNRKGKLERLK